MTYKAEPSIVGGHYFSEALTEPRKLVEKARNKLRGVRFDVIAVMGISGLVFGPVLAYAMDKRLLVVRKEDDKSTHSKSVIEGYVRPGDRVLLVDDFSSSGATCRRMAQVIEDRLPNLKIDGRVYQYKWDSLDLWR